MIRKSPSVQNWLTIVAPFTCANVATSGRQDGEEVAHATFAFGDLLDKYVAIRYLSQPSQRRLTVRLDFAVSPDFAFHVLC